MKNKKIVKVKDLVQKNYEYVLTEPIGKNFASDFKPDLTPKEMLELGVFDGLYVDNSYLSEYPKSWFTHAKLAKDKPNKDLNFFGIHASQPLSVWQKNGWIHKDDPRGWFQWYMRYFMGRRHPDDDRQIKRHKAMVRHVTQVVNNCRKGDLTCRRKQRQALLHWAYDSRKL